MRIVAVADTHTFEGQLAPIPAGDVFIHAGDLCRRGHVTELEPAVEWLRGLPHRHKIVVAGNHDWCLATSPTAAAAALGPGIIYLQDNGTEVDGVRFWGSPWQPEFNGWAFNLPRGPALAAKWALIPPGVDVLITHGPPYGLGDQTTMIGRPQGCQDLLAARARVRPRLHLFGHIHEAGGCWWTDDLCAANVTTWEAERGPSVFDLDPGTGPVTAGSIPPSGLERFRR